jgi:LacI family transcriptional regulator
MVDVAALAGVALKTVSRVVNSEPGVSPQLEARVKRAIEQLNYRRDANAATLRRLGRKTQTIGLVLEDVSNPFSSELHRAVEDAARERGVLVFAGSCDEDPDRERELIGSFRERRVDGIIVVPASHDHTYLYEERRAGTALVFVDRPASHLDADSVVSDNLGGAVQAVSHLLRYGHRRIGFLGDLLSISTAEDRLRGYTQALASAGLRVDEDLIRTELRDPDAAARAVDEMLVLADPPTAFFTGQNLLTIGGVHALR